jgi:hypothetical protein
MDMPENCFDCPFMYGRKYCLLDSKIEFNDPEYSELKNRYKGCPLIEVHELHGRLIDADKLKETIDYYISEAGWSDEINKALSWVKDEFIDSEETIIPASEEG